MQSQIQDQPKGKQNHKQQKEIKEADHISHQGPLQLIVNNIQQSVGICNHKKGTIRQI